MAVVRWGRSASRRWLRTRVMLAEAAATSLAVMRRARLTGGGEGGGGEGGIRTLDELPHTAFPVRRPRPLGDLSAEATARRRRTDGPCTLPRVAERVGFEPTVLSHTAFRERHHQPLGHLSAKEVTASARFAR